MSGTYVGQNRSSLGVYTLDVARVAGSIRDSTTSMSSSVCVVAISMSKESHMTHRLSSFALLVMQEEGSA
jgi:hypothetical protein